MADAVDDAADRSTDRPRRAWPRQLAVVAGLVVVALVMSVGISVWSIDRSIDRVDVEGLRGDRGTSDDRDDGAEATELDEAERAATSAQPITVLVLASDSREDLTREERVELGTGDAPGDRTEVIALTRFDPVRDEVRVLNIPRDSRVERCDGSVGRINSAYEIGRDEGGDSGAMSCTVRTVTALTGVAIDHVARVDFGGFVDIIDDLGGVTMELEEPLRDESAHLDLPAGCVTLDGRDALAFARARKIDDDFGRIARQQRLVEEVLEELTEVGVVDDPARFVDVARSVARSVDLDSSLDVGRIAQLAREHRATIAGGIESRAAHGEPVTVNEAWMLDLDLEGLEQDVTWLLQGDQGTATASHGQDAARSIGGAPDARAASQDADAAAPSSSSGDSDGPRTLDDRAPDAAEPSGGC